MKRNVHVFDNGVKVYDDHLTPIQRDRYRRRNVHEAEEEDIFIEILQTIPPDGCFANIGCAIGYYPLLAKRLIPGRTIHAIEPLERHRAFFVENIALSGQKQSSFIIHTEGISSSDPFYEALNEVLSEHGFDDFVEELCGKFYAEKMGRPSVAPGVYFRLLMVGYFEGIGARDCLESGRFTGPERVFGIESERDTTRSLDDIENPEINRCADPCGGGYGDGSDCGGHGTGSR